MNLSNVTKTIWATTKKHSPEILTGIGIAGMIATTVMAVKATPKALRLIEEAGYEKGADENPIQDMEFTPLTPFEIVKASWKCYIPSVITGATSIACLIGASSVNVRRNAALATAYTISETALREYKDKVVETFGEKKEQVVRDAVAKNKVEKNPVNNTEVIVTNNGNTLCLDGLSGRYFRSDIDKLKKSENALNHQMLSDGSVSLNDFYYEIGLDPIHLGDDLGWDTRTGLIELQFSSQLASDGTPCLVLDFTVAPKYDYYH